MKGVKVGVHSSARTAQETVDAIVAAEKAGIECSWLTVGGVAPDPFAIFGAAAQHTSKILFGTSIVPTFPRHPLAMAQGAIGVDSLAFLSIGGLYRAMGECRRNPAEPQFTDHCFTGDYPTPLTDLEIATPRRLAILAEAD